MTAPAMSAEERTAKEIYNYSGEMSEQNILDLVRQATAAAQAEVTVLRKFVEELSKAELVKYDADHACGGNFDDSYSHGGDVARSHIGEEAREVLKALRPQPEGAR